MSASLALNFFFLGWLAGRSPLFPGETGERFDSPLRIAGEPVEYPEEMLFRVWTRGMSREGRNDVLGLISERMPEIEDLSAKNEGLRRNLRSLLETKDMNPAPLVRDVLEHNRILQQRIALVGKVAATVLPSLDAEDRRIFMENWEKGPGRNGFPAPPPPPPPAQ